MHTWYAQTLLLQGIMSSRVNVGLTEASTASEDVLLAQLRYDRADVASVSSAAALMMDVVIAMVVDAFRNSAQGDVGTSPELEPGRP